MSKFSGLEVGGATPARMAILHPTRRDADGKPVPLVAADGTAAWIDLLSLDSAAAIDHRHEVFDARAAQKSGDPIRAKEIDMRQAELFARLTAAWQLVSLVGEVIDIECTADHARQLYAAPGMAWLAEQVGTWVDTRANYVPKAGSIMIAAHNR
jgi:hypothetical protein